MATVKQQFSRWKMEIHNHNFKTVYDEFQEQINTEKWPLPDEITLATWCLTSTNIEAQTKVKNHAASIKRVDEDIFRLTELCCESAAKSWKLVSVDFLSVVYYICKHLINSNRIDDALAVGQFAFDYVDTHGAVVPPEGKVNVPVAFLTLFLVPCDKLELSMNVDVICRIWKSIFSVRGLQIKRMGASLIVEQFTLFVFKSLKADKHHGDLFSLVNQFSILISRFDDAESTFLRFCRTVVYQLCEISEPNRALFLECLHLFHRNHQSAAVSFCGHVFALVTGTDLVAECNRELKTLIAAEMAALKDVVYFAATLLVKTRLFTTGEYPCDAASATDLFELLLTLARRMDDIDLNTFFGMKKAPRKDTGSVVFLAYFVLHFAYKIGGLELASPNVYRHVLAAEKLVLRCTLEADQLDEKKREQVYSVGGAGCANICRSYMMAGLHSECEELGLNALQCYSRLSRQELSKPHIQACMKRLVMCLHNSYRRQERYANALRTSLAWTIILPTFSDTFMEAFCSLKVKLLSANEETVLGLTCLDLLKTKENPWKHDSLNAVDFRQLSLLELKQYLKHKLVLFFRPQFLTSTHSAMTSASPVLKLLKFIDTQALETSEKAQYYVIAAKILTNKAESLTKASSILKTIEKFIVRTQKDNDSSKTNEEQRSRNCVVLGDLHYVKFRIELLSARHENESEVKMLQSLSKPPTAEPGMEPDPKDDFVPASYTYVSQTEITSLLDTAVRYWQTAARDLSNRSDKHSVTFELSHVKDAALAYRLYCDVPKEIEAWELLYAAAVLLQDVCSAVNAFSYLLTTPWRTNLEWKSVVEEEMLPKVNDALRLRFQLDHLDRCLIEDFSPKNFESLTNISAAQAKEFGMLPKYWFLMARYLYFEIDVDTKLSWLAMALQAFNIIMHQIKEGKWSSFAECCELQCSLFDLILFMISRDAEKYQVLQAKRYMKEPFALIQKLGLPLRTCQFLNVSSRLDALTCSLDDCYVKLAHVQAILNGNRSEVGGFAAPKLKLATAPPPICLSPDFRNASSRPFGSPASPILACEHQFTMPEFVDHDAECWCDACSNCEYARLLCEAMSLFAVYYGLAGKTRIASDYFEGALEMCRVAGNRAETRYGDAVALQLIELKVSTLIRCADYWAANGDYDTASKYNREAALHLEMAKNPALGRDCDEQAWSLAAIKEFKTEPKVKAKRKPTVRRDRVQQSYSACKTPARKMAPPALFQDTEEESVFANSITPYPRNSRRALEFGEFCTPLPKLRVTRKKPQLGTPPDIVLQTPSTLEKRMKKLDIGSMKKLGVGSTKKLDIGSTTKLDIESTKKLDTGSTKKRLVKPRGVKKPERL